MNRVQKVIVAVWLLSIAITTIALIGCTKEPEFLSRTECAKEETRDVQICHTDTMGKAVGGALLGGLAGHLIGGRAKTGAIVGGAFGASQGGTQRCYMKQEVHCTEYKTIQEPNPKYKRL